MSEELKPCPFCGKTPIYAVTPDGENDSIDCRCGESECFLDDGRLDQWNCRPIEDAQAVRIEALEAENRRLRDALKEIEDFANNEYGKRIPAPSSVTFRTIKLRAEKALKGAGE